MKEKLTQSIRRSFERLPTDIVGGARKIAVAVSGGGDSVALLHLLAEWCQSQAIILKVVTVDHGIRKEAKGEARWVAAISQELGLSHKLLSWRPTKTGNLQDMARRARYQMIADWAKQESIKIVVLGHTKDDQAETVMMNLARGSGVDGLSAMAETVERYGICWFRPLLDVLRGELRDHLRAHQITWIEDPSNEDDRFDRIKMRRLIAQTSSMGLGVEQLASTASRLQDARVVLEMTADEAAQTCARSTSLGDIEFNDKFWNLPFEVQTRLAADALRAVSGNEYRPRLKSLIAALDGVPGTTMTLSGCMMKATKDGGFTIIRELAACGPPVPPWEIWDGRWKLLNADPPKGLRISALGMTSKSQAEFAATPALWRKNELWSAPFIGLRDDWKFEYCHTSPHWRRFLPKDR